MHVLIIGGTGTISRAIVRALLHNGHRVTVYNRGQRADQPPSDVEVIIGDRKDRATFESTLQKRTFDVAIDMISFTADDAASSLRALPNVGHFIQTSTVMTYGPPFTALYQDTDAPLNGRHDGGYGAGKVAADELLMAAYRNGGVPVTIVKPSFTFGPGHTLFRQIDWGSSWIDRLKKRKPIIEAAEGLNYFQFLPTADAADAYVGLCGLTAAIGKTIHVVNPQALTWHEWHGLAAAALNVPLETVSVPWDVLVAADADRFSALTTCLGHNQVFSARSLHELLPHWQPRVPLAHAVSETIEWMQRHNTITDSDSDPLEDRIIAAMRQIRGTFWSA
jgi:nucleoside-diphosphate-sugar epimerase